MEKSHPVPYLELSNADSQETLAHIDDIELDESFETLCDDTLIESSDNPKTMHILQSPARTRLRLFKRPFWLIAGCLIVISVRSTNLFERLVV